MNQFFTSKYKFAEIGVRIERSHTINNKAALTITPSINNRLAKRNEDIFKRDN